MWTPGHLVRERLTNWPPYRPTLVDGIKRPPYRPTLVDGRIIRGRHINPRLLMACNNNDNRRPRRPDPKFSCPQIGGQEIVHIPPNYPQIMPNFGLKMKKEQIQRERRNTTDVYPMPGDFSHFSFIFNCWSLQTSRITL